jgi:hypothetical protein
MRAILIVISGALGLLAQVGTAMVSGIVTDRSGAVVPGTKITVIRQETNSPTNLVTNEAGFYSATALRPGRYQISVAKEGFRSPNSQPFDGRIQDRAEIKFQLEVEGAAKEIVVAAASPLLESPASEYPRIRYWKECRPHSTPSLRRLAL